MVISGIRLKKNSINFFYSSKSFIIQCIIFFVITSTIGNADAIKCYKCAVIVEKYYIKNTTVTTPMCSKFDESPEYITDCPFSTMCLKTISTLYLQNGQKQETITRGCAQQKDTTQVFRNHQWQQEHSVQEVYTEGCEIFKENEFASSEKTHCYCRGELCNSAIRSNIAQNFLLFNTLTVIFIYNFAIKRSLLV